MASSGGFGRNAALWGFGCFAAAAFLFFFSATARALPAGDAPVYAINNYPFQKAPALMRWRSVQQREAELAQRANPDECNDGEPRLACAAKEVLLLEEKLQDMSPTEQVEAVYAYFNAVEYQEHPPQCGVDCWKSRLEFLADREGDCGDHALAEYFTLKRLGFKERDLQLIVAQLPGFGDSFKGGHIVLRVRAEGEYYILDNRATELAGLSGLRKYKVLAGMNADSVQIYNLVTDAPPAGFIADATQVAALVSSPGVSQGSPDLQLAEAPDEEPTESAPQAETAETPSKPILVAAVATTPEPEPAVAREEDGTICLQSAQLGDWNPFLPCTPTKMQKIVVNAKTIIGAEPPKPAEAQPSKPIVVAEAPKAPEPKAPEPTLAAKPAALTPGPKPEAVAESDDESDACMQGARLADWNPNLPCTPDGNSSSLRIVFTD
jgi:predicted transglutaminase-like cysteine proteinase